MLILLENFEGVVIFATNLIKNYDRAFESRIFKHLKFDLPNTENRNKIIEKTIPKKVPFEQDSFLTIDQINVLIEISEGFSGRELKNAILDALTRAISDQRNSVRFSDFEMAFQQLKNNREKLQKEYEQGSSLNSDRKKILENKIRENLNLQLTEVVKEIELNE